MIDRTTKALLTIIAIGLFANVVEPLVYPRPVAAERDVTCKGELTANAFGGEKAIIGGYDVKLTCEK
jgi:hypothetical protein